jgi:hypothetical protein
MSESEERVKEAERAIVSWLGEVTDWPSAYEEDGLWYASVELGMYEWHVEGPTEADAMEALLQKVEAEIEQQEWG